MPTKKKKQNAVHAEKNRMCCSATCMVHRRSKSILARNVGTPVQVGGRRPRRKKAEGGSSRKRNSVSATLTRRAYSSVSLDEFHFRVRSVLPLVPTPCLFIVPEAIPAPRLRRWSSGPLFLSPFVCVQLPCYQSSPRHTPALPPFNASVVLCSVYKQFVVIYCWQLPHFALLHFYDSVFCLPFLQFAQWLPVRLTLRHLLLERCFAPHPIHLILKPTQLIFTDVAEVKESTHCAPRSTVLVKNCNSYTYPSCTVLADSQRPLTTMWSLHVTFLCSPILLQDILSTFPAAPLANFL